MITYSARSGLQTGLRQTFDGEHPCPLCLTVQEATADHHERAAWTAPSRPVRLLAVPVASAEAPPRLFMFQSACLITSRLSGCWPDPPPLPPPKPLLLG